MIGSTVDRIPSRFKNRRGAMLAFVAVSMVGLLGMVAIAADIGAGNRQRRIAQTAADAAAIGGGRQIERHGDSLSVVTFAFNSALRNGFANSEVTVNYYPKTARDPSHNGNPNFVEVLIVKSIPTIFGRIFNKNTLDIKAKAVAGMGSAKTYCVYSLATSGNGIELDGEMTTNCDIVANADVDLKHGVTGDPQPTVSAVGSVSGGPSGHTFTGIPPIADPYAHLVVPTFDGICEYNNPGNGNITSDQTIGPGDYCGGLTVKKNTRATMTAGTYIMRGGGITAGEIDATSGVTIINTVSPDNDPAKFKPIVFDNSCLLHLFAPTTGQFKGVAIYQDPAAPASTSPTSPTNTVNDVCGMGTQDKCDPDNPDIRGLIYFPTQSFNIGNSNGKFSIAGTIVSKYLTGLNGGGKPCVFLDNTGNSSVLRLSLVE